MKHVDKRLNRAFRFFAAARTAHGLKQLAPVGFTTKDVEEGSALLSRAFTLVRTRRFPNEIGSDLRARFDAYQSRWFPTVRAALDRHYPDLGKLFFAEMIQLDEKQSPISVHEFLETVERLGKGEAPFGAKGLEARALLATRMFTPEVEAEGQALLAEWNQPEVGAAPREEVSKEDVEAAIAAAWKWRTEWADHARAVIAERGVLRTLGIGRVVKKSSPKVETPTEGPALGSPGTAPALTPAQLPASTTPSAIAPPAAALLNGTHPAPAE